MTTPRHQVINSDIDLWIYGDEKQLGHLHVSRGGMDWFPGSSRVNKYSLSLGATEPPPKAPWAIVEDDEAEET
jgi:hypothetical protein